MTLFSAHEGLNTRYVQLSVSCTESQSIVLENHPSGMPNKYQTSFEAPYAEIYGAITTHVKNRSTIVDLGCHDGTLEDMIDRTKRDCCVYGVDIDTEALESLRNKTYKTTTVHSINRDANDYLEGTTISHSDTLLVHATLHEINDPHDQDNYLDWFFARTNRVLAQDGRLLIGDFYYHPSVPEEDVEAYIAYQQRVIGHADRRENFLLPESLIAKAHSHDYMLIHAREMRATQKIDRRHYCLVFEKT